MEPMRTGPMPGFGVGGLYLDIPKTSRTHQQCSAATNVRISDGQLATIPAPSEALKFSEAPVFGAAFYQLDDSGGHIFAFDSGLIQYVDSTGTPFDVTPEPPLTTVENLIGVQLNDIFYITNGIDLPQRLSTADIQSSGIFAPMENWPTNYRCELLIPYRAHMIALGVLIDGTPQRSLVKWSHPATPGDTSLFWDHQDPTLLAGENPLPTNGRDIMAAVAVRDSLMIFLDQSAWRMDLIGGALVMGFTKVLNDDGCIGPHACVEFDQRAMVIGFADIYVTDGHSKRSISDGKLTQEFYKAAAITDGIRLSYYPERHEVHLFYQQAGSTYDEHTVGLIYNVAADAFTLMTHNGPNNTGGVLMAYQGPKFDSVDVTYDEADAAGMTYDNSAEISYNELRTADENTEFFLLSGQYKNLRAMDRQTVNAHDPGNVYVEVDRVNMVKIFGSTGDVIKYISRLYPEASGDGTWQISLGTAMLPEGGISWGPYRAFRPLTNLAHDQRAAGRYIGIRLRLTPQDKRNVKLAGFDVQLRQPHGGRR